MKKCAIFLTVYNGEKYIANTIESVLNQTFKDFDLIIYNDGSSDQSVDIINKYLNDNRIIFIDNSENIGIGRVTNKLFKKYYSYDYICRLDVDDYYSSNYLEEQIKHLEKTNAAVSFSRVQYVDKNNTQIEVDLYHHDILKTHNQQELLLVLLNGNHFCTSSGLINNKKLKLKKFYTGFNNDRLQDQELWLNLVLLGDFVYNENTLMYYRKLDNSMSNPDKRIIQNKLEYHDMLLRFLFNELFLKYTKSVKDSNNFIERVVRELVYKIEEYDKSFILLTINFCEYMLEQSFETSYIWQILNKLYLQTGLVQKSIQNNPYKKIVCPVFHYVAIEKRDLLLSTGLFEENPEYAHNNNLLNIDVYYVNKEEELSKINSPAIVLSDNLEDGIRNDILVLSDNLSYKDKIIYYIQDKIYLYNNGLFSIDSSKEIDLAKKYEEDYNKLIQQIKTRDADIEQLKNQLQIFNDNKAVRFLRKVSIIKS